MTEPRPRVRGFQDLARRLAGRAPLGIGCAAVGVVGAAAGGSGVGVAWLLLLLAIGTAIACAPDASSPANRLSAMGLIPAAFVINVAIYAAVATGAGFLGISLWGERRWALLSWAIVNAAIATVSVLRGGRVRIVSGDVPASLALLATWSAGVAAATLQSFEVWASAVTGSTDFPRHLTFVKRIADAGNVVYDEDGYPKGLHTIVAAVWSASGGETYADGWRSLEAVLWLIICLIIVAAVITVTRAGRALRLPLPITEVVLPVLTVLTLVQGVWVTSMLLAGFATSILAGLVLAAVMATCLDGPWLGTTRSVIVLTTATVALAHSWLLLAPVTAVPLLASLIATMRRGATARRRRSLIPLALAVVIGVAVSLPPALNLVSIYSAAGGIAHNLSASPTPVALDAPRWYWYLGVMLAVVALVRAWQMGLRGWVLTSSAMVLTSAALVAGVLLVTGAAASDPGHFALKAVWTVSVFVLPPSLLGAAWLCVVVATRTGRIRSRPVRLGAAGALVVMAVIVTSGILGIVLGPRPQALSVATGVFGPEAVQIPIASAVEASGVRGQPAVVWGVAPRSTLAQLGVAVQQDVRGLESLKWFGDVPIPPILTTLSQRDAVAMCDYLREHPNAIRITGPNPKPGIGWLIESGCPASVVKADSWLVAQLTDDWYQGSPFVGQPYYYPDWQEYRKAQGHQPDASEE